MPEKIKEIDDAQTLKRLGLTPRQSKIYLALSKMKKATISTISSVSRTDRANAHRTIKQLQELGLVEKFITTPAAFKALPLDEGITLLLERRKMEFEEEEAEVKELLKRNRNHNNVTTAEAGYQFALVPGGKLTYRKLSQLSHSSERTHQGIIYSRDVESHIDFFVSLFRELASKGIRIRVIIFLEEEEKLSTKFEIFREDKQIEIRRAGMKPRTTFSIWDGKQVFLTVTPMISEPMNPGLFTENSTLVGLIQDYFDLMWRRSKPIFA